ncbi:MAG: n-acetylglutamate synthase [Candidatus Binatia bacterium]
MKYNLEGKIFRSATNTENGEVGAETLFYYHQDGEVVSAEYRGGTIVKGHLLAKVPKNSQLEMRYHHLNTKGEFMLGKCLSTPEVLPDGRLKFKESWQWLCGDLSEGYSEIEEIKDVQAIPKE